MASGRLVRPSQTTTRTSSMAVSSLRTQVRGRDAMSWPRAPLASHVFHHRRGSASRSSFAPRRRSERRREGGGLRYPSPAVSAETRTAASDFGDQQHDSLVHASSRAREKSLPSREAATPVARG